MALKRTQKIVILAAGAALLAIVAAVVFVKRHDIADHFQTAAAEQAVADHDATPLDLSAQYAHEAYDTSAGSSYWHQVPWRFQVFNGVPLQIDGLMYLWGEGNSQKGADFREEILGIPVNQKFETLYLYHCAFFSSANGAPVYDLVFRYEDGSSVTNHILYGIDVLDFNTRGKLTKPTGANSRIAWTGASFAPDKDQPLRFILTALTNPAPAVAVTSIDLYSSKGRSAACVLAMTAGKAGLMK